MYPTVYYDKYYPNKRKCEEEANYLQLDVNCSFAYAYLKIEMILLYSSSQNSYIIHLYKLRIQLSVYEETHATMTCK